MGQWLSERLGQQFIVENRPGARQLISLPKLSSERRRTATRLLLVERGERMRTQRSTTNLNFDFIRDIAPVASICRDSSCHGGQSIVSSQDGSRVHRLRQGQSGQDQYGVGAASGAGPHLSRRTVQDDDRRQLGSRAVPRQCTVYPICLVDRVQVSFRHHAVWSIGYIRAGKLRALAVTGRNASRRRYRTSRPWPNSCRATRRDGWYGIGAPKNTPAEIIDKLNKEINAALADPNVKARLVDLGGNRCSMTPADIRQIHRRRNREVGQGHPRGQHQGGVILRPVANV